MASYRLVQRAADRWPGLRHSRLGINLNLLARGDAPQLLRYGPARRLTSIQELYRHGFAEIDRPVFFLSTGRCGTMLWTMLLAGDRALKVHHAPRPELVRQSRTAYETLAPTSLSDTDAPVGRCLRELFLAARERALLYAHQARRRYVETNNRITFFAPVVTEALPQARFVHLHRHPGQFVRSGIRRGWYRQSDPHDIGRIRPLAGDPAAEHWDDWTDIERIGWLWRATNDFIERFKRTLPAERVHTVSLNGLDRARVEALLAFLDARVPARRLGRLVSPDVRPNAQRCGACPAYEDWPEDEKRRLKAVCGDLAERYGYA